MRSDIKELKTTDSNQLRVFECNGYTFHIGYSTVWVYRGEVFVGHADGSNLLDDESTIEKLIDFFLQQMGDYEKGKVKLNKKGGFKKTQIIDEEPPKHLQCGLMR